MQSLFPVLTSTGSSILPTTPNATFFTEDMFSHGKIIPDGNNCQVYIEFFSDADGKIPVTPTAGTVAVSGSPMGNNFLAAGGGGTVSAVTCSTPDSTYTPPTLNGRIAKGRATLTGITGARFCRISFWRY